MFPFNFLSAAFLLLLPPVESTDIDPIYVAKLIATSSQIPHLDQWLPVISQFDQGTKQANSSDQIIAITSRISIVMKNRYPLLLNEYHRHSLCTLYSSIIGRFNGTQRHLVLLIETMRNQNQELNLALDSHVWTAFINKFYVLPHEYHDLYFHNLLDRLTNCAKPLTPDESVFNAILLGLSTNADIKDPEKAIKSIINKAMSLDANVHLRVSATMLSTDRIIHFLTVQPTVFLMNLDVDIINAVLLRLPFYLNQNRRKIDLITRQMFNSVMFRYRISANLETYRILAKLHKEFGIPLDRIQQRNQAHDHVLYIVNRLRYLNDIRRGPIYRYFRESVGADPTENPVDSPNPMLKYASNGWESTVKKWKASFGCNTQKGMVEKMEIMITRNQREGRNISIPIWNYFFYRYYKLKVQFPDFHVLGLLNRMKGKGSNVLPDADTFSTILLGVMTNPGVQDRNLSVDFIANEIMDLYGVKVQDLRCYAKIALFWKTGRQMPLNAIDRQCFESYDKLQRVIGDTSPHLMNRALSRMKKLTLFLSSDQSNADTHSQYPSINSILHSSRETWRKEYASQSADLPSSADEM